MMLFRRISLIFAALALLCCQGCTVISVVDTAASVAVGAVKVTAKVAETAVDVTAAGVKAVTKSDDDKPKSEEPESSLPSEPKGAD